MPRSADRHQAVPPASTGLPGSLAGLFIDAGVESLRVYATDPAGQLRCRATFPTCDGMAALTGVVRARAERADLPLLITGRLRSAVRRQLGRGVELDGNAVLWLAAARRTAGQSTAVIDLSAAGYAVVGVTPRGELKDGLLVTSPRCGAGSGLNLDRVLQKLALRRDQVDELLAALLGEAGSARRREIPVRADRCGVFASSAAISDKNQGLPIAFALATALKSEVLKACRQVATPFEQVWLTGGVFRWQFCRDCATDHFQDLGKTAVHHDRDQDLPLDGMLQLLQAQRPGPAAMLSRPDSEPPVRSYPAFAEVRQRLEAGQLFFREPAGPGNQAGGAPLGDTPVHLGIDMGSTMAKLVASDGSGRQVLFQQTVSNAGDTIETLKSLFRPLCAAGGATLQVRRIGLTGSARYQVRQALIATYPVLADRITVLVENYAHARGAVAYAGKHLARLHAAGITAVNAECCVLVDVGGEDTKISTVSLARGELIDNAMNTKCSAGTGSLLDALAALYRIADSAAVAACAGAAPRARELDATCAVFLLEHARRLQVEGCGRDEILASAVWAIAENMARSLWRQIRLPAHPVVLLHGQTMLSDPLPVAVAQRLQTFLGGPAYCLVPPDPGHRACFGLLATVAAEAELAAVPVPLAGLLDKRFARRTIRCPGEACGDSAARCHRALLTAVDSAGETVRFGLGGCAAINEQSGRRHAAPAAVRDTYRDIWQFGTDRLPVSAHPRRLVIPRSFAVSEWAPLFAALFAPAGIPVHVDVVQEADILRAQPHFHIDSCAPHLGAVGQFLRLAGEPHGLILAPQIEFLPVAGGSLGRTCTINQGGIAVARSLAGAVFPESRIHLFHVDLKTTEPDFLAHKLHPRLLPVYRQYRIDMPLARFRTLVHEALSAQREFRRQRATYAAELAREALAEGRDLALVVGREYLLNPGVFDSHVGRLLRDKGLAGIPGHILDIEEHPDFAHLYWRNAHVITSLVAAAATRRLHQAVRMPEWREIFRELEAREQRPLAVVQISTFLCGPDSVTNPLIDRLVKNRPYLRIQADAALKELAHLESRMNTYVKQLVEGGAQRFFAGTDEAFDVKLLDGLVNTEPPDRATDVICFPTLADHRPVLAVLRSAGYTCLENYREDYDLSLVIRRGRDLAGNDVCAPLAAVYGDILDAVAEFRQRRGEDPAFRGKTRLLIFNNKGLGPCRQGQYVETHKLFMQQPAGELRPEGDAVVRFLVGHEQAGFAAGFPRWIRWRGIQAAMLQGVLHQLLADGAARCRNRQEYLAFRKAHGELKAELHDLIERCWAPAPRALALAERLPDLPVVKPVAYFFAAGFHRNSLAAALRRFRHSWCRPTPGPRLRIHVDGEVYMRTAQFEELHEALLATLGFGRFVLTHTPVWSFLEYKLAGMALRAREGLAESRRELRQAHSPEFRANRRRFLRSRRRRLAGLAGGTFALRQLLAGPLYRAAGVKLPDAMSRILAVAAAVIPTRRPGGELLPYLGEAVCKLRDGYDLILNVAPEGCMVSTMGEVLTPAIHAAAPGATGQILPVFSRNGEVHGEALQLALLRALGPYRLAGG